MNRYPLIKEISTPIAAPKAFELFHGELYSFFRDSGTNRQKPELNIASQMASLYNLRQLEE